MSGLNHLVEKDIVLENECVRCGACTAVCPVYRSSGGKEFYSARGRKFLQSIGEDSSGADVEDIFSQCLLCGACLQVCPRGIDCTRHVRAIRSQRKYFPGGYKKYLISKILNHPEVLTLVRRFGATFRGLSRKLPRESGLRLRLAMLDDGETSLIPQQSSTAVKSSAASSSSSLEKLLYFPGCTAQYLTPALLDVHRRLFALIGYDLIVPENLGCCGLSSFSIGNVRDAEKRAQQNIEILERYEGAILVSCASCFSHFNVLETVFAGQPEWQKRAGNIKARCVELTQFLAAGLERINAISSSTNSSAIRVFYHDPCHFRFGLKITKEPRTLLASISHFELVSLPDGAQCCGMGGLFHLGSPELSATIRDDLRDKVLALSPDIITTTCSGCLMQWRSALAATNSDIKVMHLSELLYDSLLGN